MAKKYQEFNVGKAGNGAIDLATGKLTFVHQTTDAESTILPVGVTHVCQSKLSDEENSLYGRGWKLNLNQTLQKVLPDDPNDTRHIYTDGSGVEHEFHEKYFFRKNKDKIYYLPNTTTKIVRSDIRIDLDGRMWLIKDESIEIFSELVTDSGLILHIRPEGFEGSKKIETRHEELIRVENEIKSITRQIEDLEGQIEQNSNFEAAIVIESENFNSLRQLQQHIQNESQKMEELAISDFNDGIKYQERLMSLQDDFRKTTAKSVQGPVWTIVPRNLVGDYTDAASFREYREDRWTHNDFNARMMDSIQTMVNFRPNTTQDSNLRRVRAGAHYQRLYQETIEKIQQEIQNISAGIEGSNWDNKIRNTEKRSILINFQKEFGNIQRKFEEARLKLMLDRWNEDLIECRIQLARRQHAHRQLLDLLPVNYIIADNILGFNEDGNLVAIFDDYDNQVGIMYEGDRITHIVDSENRAIVFEYIDNRLDHIKDFQDRKTYFKYDLENRIKSIVYPDGEISTYEYNDKHVLTDIMPPSRIGKRLTLDNQQRVTKILNRSAITKIDINGVEEGKERVEDIIGILYDTYQSHTIITDIKTKESVTYYFNENKEVIHEHIKSKFEQRFITYYENDYNEVAINEEITGTNDVKEVMTQHLLWVNAPETLPMFKENLVWQVADLDGEGNVLRRRYSQTVLTTDESIRRSIEETFTYKHFTDGRQALLVRSDTLVTTTDEPDRLTHEEYFYNKQGDLIRTISEPDGIIEETGYSDNGIVISSIVYHKSNPDQRFVEKSEVNESGQVLATYDERGTHKTAYNYIKGTNKVSKITDSRGGHTIFGHDFKTSRTNSISSTSNGERNGTTYSYTADFLTKLESTNTKFNYAYDSQGRTKSIHSNDESIAYVSYDYTTQKHNANNGMGLVECDVVTSTYASGKIYTSFTDKFGRLLSIHYKNKKEVERVILTNFYDEDRVVKVLDYKTNETILFEYDNDGNIIKQVVKGLFADKVNEIPGQHLSISQDFNINGVVDKLTYEIDNRTQVYEFDYEDEEPTQIILPSKDILKVDSDNLGRAEDIKIIRDDELIINDKLSFVQHAEHATNLVNSHTQRIGKNSFNKTHYTYDENGNISEIRQSGIIIVRYKYDELNRLTREDNRKLDKTFLFEYDNNGNILNKRELSFTLDKILIEGIITNYSYFGEGDQLTLFNGERFEYDVLGNPVVYRNHNLKWSHLRNLEKFNTVEFKYNIAGLRVYKDYQKDIDGVPTRFESRYHWANDRLISETRTSTNNTWLPSNQPIEKHPNDLSINTTIATLDFIYGTNSVIGFTLDNKDTFYYVKNIQGDVLKITDNKGNIVAEYNYDAWGNHEILMSINGMAELNPIRYRSYYFDEETGLYYLKSRYYDAQIGRFINMDSIEILDIAQSYINGLNLFAYCFNNPVMMIDDDGNWPRWLQAAVSVVAIGVIVGLTVMTGGLAGVVLKGAAIGSIIGAGSSVIAQVITPGSINWSQVLSAGFTGAIAGALAATGLGKMGLTLGQGTLSFGSSVVSDLANNGSVNWGRAILSGVIAGGMGAILGGAGAQHAKLHKRQKSLASMKRVNFRVAQGKYANINRKMQAVNDTKLRLEKSTNILRSNAMSKIRNRGNIRNKLIQNVGKDLFKFGLLRRR